MPQHDHGIFALLIKYQQAASSHFAVCLRCFVWPAELQTPLTDRGGRVWAGCCPLRSGRAGDTQRQRQPDPVADRASTSPFPLQRGRPHGWEWTGSPVPRTVWPTSSGQTSNAPGASVRRFAGHGLHRSTSRFSPGVSAVDQIWSAGLAASRSRVKVVAATLTESRRRGVSRCSRDSRRVVG